MTHRYCSRISLATLIICLCFGSLVVLPILNTDGPFVPGIMETDSDNYNLLEQAESDDDFVAAPFLCIAIVGLILLLFRTMNLVFESITIASVFPPPKQA